LNVREQRYTDSRLKLVGWTVARALLIGAASGSGLFGSMLPGCTAYHAVEESFPPVTWWRTGARAGIAAAETFANNGTRPTPPRARRRVGPGSRPDFGG
jgi:hypothetical protein